MIPPIVFFDMEGTLLRKSIHLDDGLVAASAWTLLAERLGPECLAAENETKVRWRRGEYPTYIDWMRSTIEVHRSFGLTRPVFMEVIEAVEMTPHAEEALARVRILGSATVLITGGFKALADRVQRRLRIDHALAACDYFFDQETGLLEHANLLPADEAGKVDFMRLMCREYKVDPAHCAFVGDGMNDVHLARQVGFSIAFNGQPELCEVVTECIRQPAGEDDFLAVADLLESRSRAAMPESQHRSEL